MRVTSGKELCKLLEKNGWILKTVQGSHHVYMKEGQRARISVPVHGNKSLKVGLLKALLKLAEISLS